MLHHIQKRKRLSRGLSPYPHPSILPRFLDAIVYVVGILAPLFTIPQMYDIFSTRSAAGVSFISWMAYALFDIPWVVYGIVHKEPVITTTYTLWFLMNASVAFGVVLYGIVGI